MDPIRGTAPKTVAVIEIGTTAVRMVIADILAGGEYRMLENVQQAVTLGRPAFASGRIDSEATEECVNVLRSFRRLMDEHGVRLDDVTAVATSAVREAENCQSFLDRLYIATGLVVSVIDSAEVNRFTYLAVQPDLHAHRELRRAEVVVVEVGGGSTEVLRLHARTVGDAHTYRLGSFRLRKSLEQYRAPSSRLAAIMQTHARREVDRIVSTFRLGRSPVLLALGSDARFAAAHLDPKWDKKDIARVKVSHLARLTKEVLDLSVDDVAARFKIHYPEAENLGPALLIYLEFARALGLKTLRVSGATLRAGILAELASQGAWSEEFRRQVVASAVALGRKFSFDEGHARHVADLAVKLFRRLQAEHRLDSRHELILTIASLLHDIGQQVNNSNHHKHTMYLVQNSDIFGLGHRDRLLTSLVARYHRRATPRRTHLVYSSLDRDERVSVAKLAAILRVADALDRGHVQRRRQMEVALREGQVVITVHHGGDLTLEQHGLQEKGEMFERVYGLRVILRGA
jgi:exopolyphosphatase/guanosine-5'-triphosphate,3'-diphosphate pyrophosphatase